MDKDTFGAVVRATLDDLLVPVGFTSGQGGDGPASDRDQVIYCAATQTFAERFPDLMAPDGYDDRPGTCVDLIVEGSVQTGVIDVRFEGIPIGDLLRRAGHPTASSAQRWPGTSLPDDMSRIRNALTALLAT